MNISYSCIDSGYLAYRVYEFCEDFGHQRCVAIKGSDTQPIVVGTARPVTYTKQNKRRGNVMFRVLGVSMLKQQIYSKLKLAIDYENGVVPAVYYFKGLCSEVYRKVGGKDQWVKIVERNEPLDLRVYSYAAGYIQGYNRMNDEWFQKESTMFNPERKAYTARPVRQRRESDHWRR
jgi:phage terminase large subunit GpA-like protein